MSKDNCYKEHPANGGGFQPGWTDSKVLMIKGDAYRKIIDKI